MNFTQGISGFLIYIIITYSFLSCVCFLALFDPGPRVHVPSLTYLYTPGLNLHGEVIILSGQGFVKRKFIIVRLPNLR